MKTILVVYTQRKLNQIEMDSKKRYVFNTNNKVKVGDMLKLDGYNDPVQVAAICDQTYEYVNTTTNQFRQKMDGTNVYRIREIRIQKNTSNGACIVNGCKL